MNLNSKKTSIACILIITISFISTGCASKYGAQTTQVAYYPACYAPIEQLRRDETSVNDSTTTGALAGALLGALIGGLSTGKAEGALAGAAVGGVTGGVAGHMYGTSKAEERDQEFYRQYAGQLDAETAQMSRANASAKISAQCYDKEFKKVVADAKAGTISKIELTNRYEEIRSGLEETSRILKVTYNNMNEKDAQYNAVMTEEAKVYDPVYAKNTKKPANTAQRQAAVKQASASTKNWQSSKKQLNSTKQDIDEQMLNNDKILEAALLG